MEGVLTPEIWIAVAEKTGIAELRLTTRDEPDYAKLMKERLAILERHRLKLSDIQAVIGTLDPLPGAREFLDGAGPVGAGALPAPGAATRRLGGGCFLNHLLSSALGERLRSAGLEVFEAAQVPPNDGGLSLGQAWIALQSGPARLSTLD